MSWSKVVFGAARCAKGVAEHEAALMRALQGGITGMLLCRWEPPPPSIECLFRVVPYAVPSLWPLYSACFHPTTSCVCLLCELRGAAPLMRCFRFGAHAIPLCVVGLLSLTSVCPLAHVSLRPEIERHVYVIRTDIKLRIDSSFSILCTATPRII